MLASLQKHLTEIYRADPGFEIADYLITDPALAKTLGNGALTPNTDESVLIRQDQDGLALSLYLNEELLERLDRNNPLECLRTEQLQDLCKVIEGISHFNYVAWSARQDKSVTLLELEMQAEVDKFVGTWLLALDQKDFEFASCVHRWLFDDVSFNPQLRPEQHERYRAANDYAARFCHGISQRLDRDSATGLDELRHFYRLSQQAKISHIHATIWGQ
jgi:hypothetical protein